MIRSGNAAQHQGGTLELFAWGEAHADKVSAPPAQNPRSLGADELPDEWHQVVLVLDRHRGKAEAITALGIAREAGLWPDGTDGSRARKIRQLFELHADDMAAPIVADSTGFYTAATAEEISHYDANLTSRIRALFRRRASHRRNAKVAGYTHRGQGIWSGRDCTGKDR